MKKYSMVHLQRRPRDVTDDAIRGPVALTSHGQEKYVLVSKDYFDRLMQAGDPRRAYTVDNMPDEMRAELLKALDEALADEDIDG